VRAHDERFLELGQGLRIILGLHSGEQYNEQSIKLNTGDMILAFSDGATEVHSPDGEELTAKGFLKLRNAPCTNFHDRLPCQLFPKLC